MDALRGTGATVNPLAEVKQPFLSGSGTSVQVNNETVQIFEYADDAAARADAAKIQPNGMVPGMTIMWTGPPHFYIAGRVIVIYAGTDQTVLAALGATAGTPFAVGSQGPGQASPTP